MDCWSIGTIGVLEFVDCGFGIADCGILNIDVDRINIIRLTKTGAAR